MSAIANITVFDGQATPVSHTFLPESVSREGTSVVASYKEAAAGVPENAQGRILIKRTKLGSGVTRVETNVELPVMESVSGVNASGYTAAPKVAFTDRATYVHYAHERSLISGRRSARQLLANLMGNVATSVAAAATGPVPEAVDLGIAPT